MHYMLSRYNTFHRDGFTAVRKPPHGRGTFLTIKRMELFDVSRETLIDMLKPFEEDVKPVLVFNDGVFFRKQKRMGLLYKQLNNFARTISDLKEKVLGGILN